MKVLDGKTNNMLMKKKDNKLMILDRAKLITVNKIRAPLKTSQKTYKMR